MKDYFTEVKLNDTKTGLEFISKVGANLGGLKRDIDTSKPDPNNPKAPAQPVKVKYYDAFGHLKTFDVNVVMKQPETTLARRANF